MTPDSPIDPRSALESRLTALLLGELPHAEAAALHQKLAQDPELAALYERLKHTTSLVRETLSSPAQPTADQPAPLRLSEDRRQKLLQHFKTAPERGDSSLRVPAQPQTWTRPSTIRREYPRPRQWWANPLVQIASAVATLMILAALLLPALSKSKSESMHSLGIAPSFSSETESAQLAQMAHEPARPRQGYSDLSQDRGTEKSPMGVTPLPRAMPAAAESAGSAIVLPKGGEPDAPEVAFRRRYGLQGEPAPATKGETLSGGMGGGGYLANAPAPPPIQPIAGRLENQVSTGPVPMTPPSVTLSVVPASEPAGVPAETLGQRFGGVSGSGAVPVPAPPQPRSEPANYYAFNAGSSGTALQWSFDARSAPDLFTKNNAKVPELGDVPAVGRFFRTQPGAAGAGDLSFKAEEKDKLADLAAAANQDRRKYGADLEGRGERALRRDIQNFGELAATNAIVLADNLATTSNVAFADYSNDGALDLLSQLGHEPKEAQGKPSTPIALPSSAPEPSLYARAKSGANEQSPQLAGAQRNLDEALSSREILEMKIASERGDVNPPSLFQAEDLGKAVTGPTQPSVGNRISGLNGREQQLAEQDQKIASAKKDVERLPDASKASADQQSDVAPAKPAAPAPVPQPEVQTTDNAFSTFSLNVSDVSFKLAAASLEKGVMPEPATVRSEEFINAFDYRDPEPSPGVPVAFAFERAQDPFAQNRDLLRFSIKTAAQGRQAGRPMNIVLLLDTSGSMERADRVQIIREALRVLAAQLQPQDKFSVVTFSRTARLWVDGVPGAQAAQVADDVSGITPEGGTNLEDALNLAYATALRHYLANGINRVVLLTDGAANLGNVDSEALKQKVEVNRKQGIALDCFGIGWEGYNDDLLEVLSRNGDGRYGFLNTPDEAATGFAAQLAGALHVAASDVKVQVEFNPARVTAYRQIGYAKHQLTKEQFRDNTVNAAQIGAAESGNALYVIAVNPAGTGPLATVRVRFHVPGTSDVQEHEWSVPYTGNAAPLDQASPAMRLAATASAFSEWLASSPYAAEVTPDRLLTYLGGVPEVNGADGRPKKLEWMVRQAKSLAGK